MDFKNKDLCNRIEEIMREKGLTQKQLAFELGMDQPSISAILKLKRSPMALVDKMASIMNVSKGWLMTGEGMKYNISEFTLPKTELMDIQNLNIEERAKIINDINLLYQRHQDLLKEASSVMKEIVEMNKLLLFINT